MERKSTVLKNRKINSKVNSIKKRTARLTSQDRAKKIDRAIRLAWSSLESHLEGAHRNLKLLEKKNGESNKFHKQCVKEYAEIIKILSELY